jgi:hypothetical protein
MQNKLKWSQENADRWVAHLSADMYFVISRSNGVFKLHLEAPIIDRSNDFHETFETQTEAVMRAEEMFDGLEKLFS